MPSIVAPGKLERDGGPCGRPYRCRVLFGAALSWTLDSRQQHGQAVAQVSQASMNNFPPPSPQPGTRHMILHPAA